MLREELFVRQSGLVDSMIFHCPVHVIGAGGIGSFTVLALAKMGFYDITVWDDDMVEEHNLPNQFYPIEAIGKKKVEALREVVQKWTGVEIKIVSERFTRDKVGELHGVVIMAVDSMKARSEIWDAVIKSELVIACVDGRMGANQLEVYTVSMRHKDERKAYKKLLWKDEETAQVPCTQKAVMYNVLTIASWITNQVRLVLSKKEYHKALILDLENMILVIPTSKEE